MAGTVTFLICVLVATAILTWLGNGDDYPTDGLV